MACKPEDVPKFLSYWLPNSNLNREANARKLFQQLLQQNPDSVRIVALAIGVPTFDGADFLQPKKVETDLFNLFLEEKTKLGKSNVKTVAWFEGVFIAHPTNLIKDYFKKEDYIYSKDDVKIHSNPNNPIIGLDTNNTTGSYLLDPLNPIVQEQLMKLVKNISSRSDISAIEFDDHFSILTKDQQKQENGISPRSLILKKHPAPKGVTDDVYLKSELTKLLKRIKAAANKKPIYISINSSFKEAQDSAQDIDTWVKENLVDKVNVQVYRPDFKSFERVTGQAVESAKKLGLNELSIGVINRASKKDVTLEVLREKSKYLNIIRNSSGINVYGVGFDFQVFYSRCRPVPINPKTRKKAYSGNCFSFDDLAADGSLCGYRAALLKPGGFDYLDT